MMEQENCGNEAGVSQEWCTCRVGQENTGDFYENNTCSCGIHHHHYHCISCGRVTQVG